MLMLFVDGPGWAAFVDARNNCVRRLCWSERFCHKFACDSRISRSSELEQESTDPSKPVCVRQVGLKPASKICRASLSGCEPGEPESFVGTFLLRKDGVELTKGDRASEE